MSIQLPFSPSHVKLKLKFWNKRSISINDCDSVYKGVYMGNVVTPWAKGDTCVDIALATLWTNYFTNVKQDTYMTITVCNSGLKAVTKEHGLTEYWANRITYCAAHPQYPRVFCWVYRHETRRFKQELRCHAILCGKEDKAQIMVNQLNQKLTAALQEFRREKLTRQKARLTVTNSTSVIPTLPRRKQLLITGTANFRPPLERARSAPKLTAIEELEEEDSEFEEDLITDLAISDLESSLDVVIDDVQQFASPDVGSVSGQYTSPVQFNELDIKLQKIPFTDDRTRGDGDSVSTESGYGEDKEISLNTFSDED
ncbi:protein FAM43A-like [Limulus polyphemus]|uniref:Protein FAM43A-like n=1 Tax=Limulus polyphemus TaxID=6850 RepID=A0ABM1C5X0_LIMPO|nr:protein FAM43A-like [Limulus polyphemus]